jgi:predicted lipoprotein with Yx(FWY)xxD motif
MTGSRPFSQSSLAAPAARILALAAVVAAISAAVAGTSIAASGTSATLTANKRVAGLAAVVYGSSIKLSGHENLTGSKTYDIQAETWPFKSGFSTIKSGTTSGDYSVVVTPSHATKYRVVIGNGPTSHALTVYVLDKRLSMSCNLCHLSNSPGTHTLTVTARFRRPPGPTGSKGPVYLYYALNQSSVTPDVLNQVASAPRHFSGDTFSFTVSYTVQFPNATFRFGEAFCWKDDEARSGVGLPGHHGCGNATINRLQHYIG